MKWRNHGSCYWESECGRYRVTEVAGPELKYSAWGPLIPPDEPLTSYNSYKFPNPYAERSWALLGVERDRLAAARLCAAHAKKNLGEESDAA